MEDTGVLMLRIPMRYKLAKSAYFAYLGRREQIFVDHVAYLGRKRLKTRSFFRWCSHYCGRVSLSLAQLAQQAQGK